MLAGCFRNREDAGPFPCRAVGSPPLLSQLDQRDPAVAQTLEARSTRRTRRSSPADTQRRVSAACRARPKKIRYRHRSAACLQLAEELEPAQAPDAPDRFPDDPTGHLGLARIAVREHDGDFDDAEATLPGTQAHLDLECITF